MDDDFTAWAAGAEQPLLRSAYLLTGDLHRAEDLVQEALVKVALRWRRLRAGYPTAYARRIIANDHVSWWRRHGREVPVADVHDGAVAVVAAASVSSDPEAVLVVQKALARLTPSQRAVVVLRHFDDLSERETAEALGVSVGTVKSQNSAALARLRSGAPELLDLVAPAGLGERAVREAGRRRAQRRVVGGAALAVVLVVLAGVLVTRGDRGAEPPPIAPTTVPTTVPSGTAAAAPRIERWDPFTVVDAPVRASVLPRRLDPPPARSVPSVLREPLPGGAVLALPEPGADLRLLGTDGTWRCVAGTADLLADTLGGTLAPALSYDGTQVAFATYDGIRVVDVTTGADRTVPWPKPIAERWDNPPALTWLPGDEGWYVAHWSGGWLVRPDGTGEQAPYGRLGSMVVTTDRDGTAVEQPEAYQGFDVWQDGRKVRTLPSSYWATGVVSGFGRIAFVGSGTQLPTGTTGLLILDVTAGDLLAAASVPDPNSVYGNNGYLRTVGLLDADTVLALVGPMRFGEMEIGAETWHLVAWHPSTGAFERLTSGPSSMGAVSVAMGLLASP
ncbi:SigE family RNA polymerase sigma factor [Pimelobacter simplex]|uniref:SigE family RNA polymerase sigma factor n=1 Tax=Nocardioides simplex TaxID=2045 RepID=UPI00214FC35F|nr:SigE family RNA polymerase sigma factor [Pimelobacter simplex]UUW88939.1 SigE family RNA polymerase sigma factor [Pimelobacter simplex]UUW98444.1 SigE family RNA polymerase sigma factor [Pimelobacter simplex]